MCMLCDFESADFDLKVWARRLFGYRTETDGVQGLEPAVLTHAVCYNFGLGSGPRDLT